VQETVIWRFSDGRAGHDRQSLGLLNALREQRPVAEYVVAVAAGYQPFRWWLQRVYPPGDVLPSPALLVGAGHASHAHLLAARRARGGRSVVLMKPSLPRQLFDLCLVPEHDGVCESANTLVTQGVLNTVRNAGEHRIDTGLIVVGGPSRHYHWNDAELLAQLRQLLLEHPLADWRLTTSPRTPAALLGALADLPGVDCRFYDDSKPDWLPEQLALAGEVWVTEDSVSMLYEALSSGARVGVLPVPRQRPNRITAGVDRLISRCQVGVPGAWQAVAGSKLNEAARCAHWIDEQWLSA